MNIPTVLSNMKGALVLDGVEVYDHIPDSLQTPCVVLEVQANRYDNDLSNNTAAAFKATCFDTTAAMRDSQLRLWGYTADDRTAHEWSIRGALAVNTNLSGAVEYVRVIGHTGIQRVLDGTTEYLAVEVQIEVVG